MMPLGSECCKCSKLLVDLFLESYTRHTTHNGILKNCTVANMLLHFGKPTEMSHGAYSILLAQLMATLIHYTFTLPLSGLVDWFPYLERLLSAL